MTRAVAQIKLGLQESSIWVIWRPGGTGAMHLISPDSGACCNRMEPGDYVIGTGEAHSLREFVEAAFAHANLDWHDYVEIDPRYYRPAEVDFLLADTSKAREKLEWEPTVGFRELVRLMVDADIDNLETTFKGGHAAIRRAALASG
jgi:GDPmannose 4,6-dehydratase